MNSTMRIKRPLPPAPKPTRPVLVKNVTGIEHHLEVRPEKPPVIVETRKKPKRRTPSEAIAESARKKSEAKRQRKAEAIRLWESGMTVQEIAEHMELKVGAICDYTRDVREAKSRTERHKYDADVIRLYNAGKTYKQIGEAVGISTEHVSQILSRLREHNKVGRRHKLWRGR